jgi:NhaP-type Na+/H+ or K+/H+ antiporter
VLSLFELVAMLATFGVLISMPIVGAGLWLAARAPGTPLDFAWALVFGALIAPTDPVAVLSTLKAVNVPEALKTDISGVGVALFTIALQLATGPTRRWAAFRSPSCSSWKPGAVRSRAWPPSCTERPDRPWSWPAS